MTFSGARDVLDSWRNCYSLQLFHETGRDEDMPTYTQTDCRNLTSSKLFSFVTGKYLQHCLIFV